MIAFSHKEHQAARLMLIAVAILTILRWVMWSITTESPWWVRGILGAAFGALLLILVPALWQWSKEKIASDNLPVQTQVVSPSIASKGSTEPKGNERFTQRITIRNSKITNSGKDNISLPSDGKLQLEIDNTEVKGAGRDNLHVRKPGEE